MGRRRSWEEQRRIDQQNDYDYCNTTQVKLKLNNKTDADILKWIDEKKKGYGKTTSIQGEIKRLIREEISKAEE